MFLDFFFRECHCLILHESLQKHSKSIFFTVLIGIKTVSNKTHKYIIFSFKGLPEPLFFSQNSIWKFEKMAENSGIQKVQKWLKTQKV